MMKYSKAITMLRSYENLKRKLESSEPKLSEEKERADLANTLVQLEFAQNDLEAFEQERLRAIEDLDRQLRIKKLNLRGIEAARSEAERVVRNISEINEHREQIILQRIADLAEFEKHNDLDLAKKEVSKRQGKIKNQKTAARLQRIRQLSRPRPADDYCSNENLTNPNIIAQKEKNLEKLQDQLKEVNNMISESAKEGIASGQLNILKDKLENKIDNIKRSIKKLKRQKAKAA